jgi:hypothetical protein
VEIWLIWIMILNIAMEQVYIRNQELILAEFVLNDAEERREDKRRETESIKKYVT